MKGLATLIRLAKFSLDEKRRQLAELERLREHLLQSLQRLEVEVGREQQTAAQNADPFNGYPSYARAALDRRAVIEQSLVDLAPKLGEAAEAVTAAFQEFKRYELAEENNRRRAAEKDRRREQANLDATGLARFQRARRTG